MKYQIRRETFETNSSSMHSLVILKDEDIPKPKDNSHEFPYVYKDGTWRLYSHSMEFGRSPFKCLSTFRTKWLYCCAALCDEYKDKVWNELERIAIAHVPGLTQIVPELGSTYWSGTEKELIKKLSEKEKKFGHKLDYWESTSHDLYYDYPFTGYAEDYGMLKGFLEEKNISLEEFITNKKYVVIVDGDEYCIFSELKRSGLIDKKKIEYEYAEVHDYDYDED